MADEERSTPESPDSDEEVASTPFDSPWFIPVLLWAGAAWFGYDIVTNAQAYQDNPKFNEYGLLIMSVLALYFTWSAIKEKRAERDGSTD